VVIGPVAKKSPVALAAAMFIVAAVALDQYTKRLIESSLRLGESFNVIPGFFDITHIKNTGSAFGLLSQFDSAWVQRGLTAFTFFALLVIVMLYRSMTPADRIGRLSLILIGAGAIGNLIDRIRQGGVTDFLLFYIGKYQWPAFNVADSLITTGVVLLSYTLIFLHQKSPANE